MSTIYFDMDGTIANLYGVEGWLDYLINENATPYEVAKPMFNFSYFARLLKAVQRRGYKIGVISWLSKSGSTEYAERVTKAKMQWLHKHLPSVTFDEIHICEYGCPKEIYCKSAEDILIDDEKPNRDNWTGISATPNEIINILKDMII